jgi:hypothetical protein
MLQAGTCAALAASLPGLPALRHLDLGDIQMGGPGMMITVDSGIASYDYIIPMLTK